MLSTQPCASLCVSLLRDGGGTESPRKVAEVRGGGGAASEKQISGHGSLDGS